MTAQYIKRFFSYICILWVGIILCFSCTSEPNYPKLATDDFILGGIQINEPDLDDWMTRLDTIGMNTVSVTVYARQGIWDTDNLWWDGKEKALIQEIKAAKAKGLKVVLIPRVVMDHYFEENRFLWHGMTMPQDSLIESWFFWYTSFIQKWAKEAEQLGVDVLAIGSELRTLSQTQPITELPNLESYYLSDFKQNQYIQTRMAFKEDIPKEHWWVRGEKVNYKDLNQYLEDEVTAKRKWAEGVAYNGTANQMEQINQRRKLILEQWYKLIASVRTSYSGQLTYAANFDNYQHIAFWDKLDFIGINAYFKLRARPIEQTDAEKFAEMKTSWDNVFQEIYTFQFENDLQHPVIFTELGYIFREHCSVMPWEGFGFSIVENLTQNELIVWQMQDTSYTERALAIKALREVNQDYQLLQGILYWKIATKWYQKYYEPFALQISTDTIDPMQTELLEFLLND